MILIADSGATKTDWSFGTNESNAQIIQTQGINPFHQSVEQIRKILKEELCPHLEKTEEFTNIYFYGAGCTIEKSYYVQQELLAIFKNADVEVRGDLLGATRSLCGRESGIACILGTGSNSCFYNGQTIIENIPPLGYILGDEGSGASLGKRLVGDCLKGQLPKNICEAFERETRLKVADVIEKVYRQPQPNRFLASLAPFLAKYREVPEIHELLISSFTDFFRRNVMQYPQHRCADVHFTGSIAWYFQEEVKEAASAFNLRLGKFIKNPIQGLISYHFYQPEYDE